MPESICSTRCAARPDADNLKLEIVCYLRRLCLTLLSPFAIIGKSEMPATKEKTPLMPYTIAQAAAVYDDLTASLNDLMRRAEEVASEREMIAHFEAMEVNRFMTESDALDGGF